MDYNGGYDVIKIMYKDKAFTLDKKIEYLTNALKQNINLRDILDEPHK